MCIYIYANQRKSRISASHLPVTGFTARALDLSSMLYLLSQGKI